MLKLVKIQLAGLVLGMISVAGAGADNPLDKQINAPAIEAATVISDFGINHDEAAAKYSQQSFVLQGRVIAVGGASLKATAGHAGAHVQLGPSNADTSATFVLWVDFAASVKDPLSKVAKGDLVQMDVSYTPTAASTKDHTIRGFTATSVSKAAAAAAGAEAKSPQLRDQMVDWVRKNQSMKPGANGGDNALIRKMASQIDASLGAGSDFSILFGGGLMKSNKPTALCEQDGKMLVQEFTDTQFAGTRLGPMSTTVMDAPTKAVRLPPMAEISQPVLEGDGNWNITQPLKGTLQLKPLANFPADTKNIAVRMVCYAGNLRMVFVSAIHLTPGADTTALAFEGNADARSALMSARPPGPRVVFFEVVQMPDADKQLPEKVISEPAAVILNITDK
jgi:hypothetical protein